MNDATDQKIACIGWGSLVWDPQGLPVLGGWQSDGPELPIEFARQSQRDKKISLVLCAGVPLVTTFWALLDTADIQVAKAVLAEREGIPNPHAKSAGYWNAITGDMQGNEGDAVAVWASARHLGGVVWTSLPPRFPGTVNGMPSGEEVVRYLDSLDEPTKKIAEDYVRRTRPQIMTPYRRLIEGSLGWTFRDE
jgi:hypothetical protein